MKAHKVGSTPPLPPSQGNFQRTPVPIVSMIDEGNVYEVRFHITSHQMISDGFEPATYLTSMVMHPK